MPAGRPTEYKDSYAEKAYKFCAKFGFDDKALGELFDVSERTINTWKQAHPEFLQSLKKGKDEYDSEEVENSLLKRAMGYEYVEEIQEISPRADPQTGEAQLRITRKITKQVVPDVTAQIFWSLIDGGIGRRCTLGELLQSLHHR